MAKFRTRQAPSPTGYLHIGTARTLLFTALLAKYHKGEWYLRLEDTDRNRLVPTAAQNLLQSLALVYLNPPEGITLEENGEADPQYQVYQKGNFGPYIQSERLSIYHNHAQKLLDKGLAYWSSFTDTEKQDLVAIKQASKQPIDYYQFTLQKHGEDYMTMSLQEGLEHADKPALRYKIQRDEVVECEDTLLGKMTFDLNLEEDFVIIKNDGYPTYHFAHLIDDHLMETTLVFRTQEWLPSFGKNVTMFRDYWGEAPDYLHMPFILGETGNKKLSKRDAVVDLMQYLGKGILPEALINYLAFLGWNPGTEQELFLQPKEVVENSLAARMSLLLDHLGEEFTVSRFTKSPARFNSEKLQWFNREYIKMLPVVEFVERGSAFVQKTVDFDALKEHERLYYLLDQNRAQSLIDFGLESEALLHYTQPSENDLVWKKLTFQETQICLRDIWQQVLLPLSQSEAAQSILTDQKALYRLCAERGDPQNVRTLLESIAKTYELVCKDWLQTYHKDVGSHLWPLRVALSGKVKSPSPFELLAVLPFSVVEERIQSLLSL